MKPAYPARNILYSIFCPLLVLLVAISLACVGGYFIVHGINEQLQLRKVISKLTQLLLVLSIFPAAFYLKLSKEDLGVAVKAVFLKQLFQGFGLGFITLLPVFILLYVLGVDVINEAQLWTWGFLFNKLIIAVLLALLISLIEEPLFRGVLLAGLNKKLPVILAILISAFYYAVLHFLDSKTLIPVEQLTIFSGFQLMSEAFANLLRPEIIPAFFALLMVGLFLGLLRTRVKSSLGLCIGCHTCWVWQIKVSKSLFKTNLDSEYLYLVSRYDGVIGHLVTVWLLLVVAGYFVYQRLRVARSV